MEIIRIIHNGQERFYIKNSGEPVTIKTMDYDHPYGSDGKFDYIVSATMLTKKEYDILENEF